MPAPIIQRQPEDDDDAQQPSSPLTQWSPADDSSPQPAQSPMSSPAGNPPPPQQMPVAPVAPTFDQSKYDQIEQQVTQARAPINPNDPTVKPKWYDRLAGAAIGFGAGYRGGAAEGAAVGGAVTDRRFNQAEAQQQARQKQAEGSLSDFENQQQMAQRNFSAQSQNYENQLSGVRTANEQSNADRNFNRETANDKFTQGNSDREYERQVKNDTNTQSNNDRNFNQKQTDDNRNYSLNKERVGIESKREGREEQDAAEKRKGTGATQLRARTEANKLDQKRQSSYSALENGDNKGNAGYRQQLKELQDPNSINPDTNKKYTAQERQDGIDQLNQDHAKAKQQIEDDYSAQMNNLGMPVDRVVYDAQGNPVGQNQGQQQQATPAQEQAQSIVTPKTKTKVSLNQVVNVGGRQARITGFRNGKPTITYIEQGQ